MEAENKVDYVMYGGVFATLRPFNVAYRKCIQPSACYVKE